jgi:hypothetical protein
MYIMTQRKALKVDKGEDYNKLAFDYTKNDDDIKIQMRPKM